MSYDILVSFPVYTWNNGTSGAKLDLTSSTTPELQIRVIGCCVTVPRSYWSAVPTPLLIYISQLLRDSFSVSQQPPLWDACSHYSMEYTHKCLMTLVYYFMSRM